MQPLMHPLQQTSVHITPRDANGDAATAGANLSFSKVTNNPRARLHCSSQFQKCGHRGQAPVHWHLLVAQCSMLTVQCTKHLSELVREALQKPSIRLCIAAFATIIRSYVDRKSAGLQHWHWHEKPRRSIQGLQYQCKESMHWKAKCATVRDKI